MKSALKAVPLAAATCVLVWSLPTSLLAADGILVTEKTTTGAKIETRQMQIERTRMRAEVTGPTGDLLTMIFDNAKQTLWILNVTKKTYSELTKADADAMGGQIAGAAAQMQEAMRGMTPEQRAQMEAMMRGRGLGGPPAQTQTEYRRAGTDRVGRWACNKYDGYRGGQKTAEVCTVEPTAMGLVAADFEVAKQMADFFARLVPQASDSVFKVGGADPQGYTGVPVRRVTSFGPRQTTAEITEAVRQTFPESTFAVPADFQKETTPFGRGQ